MRGLDRAVLARAALWAVDRPECEHRGELWNTREALHAEAPNQQAAFDAATPLLAICGTCPVVDACRQWAEIDEYTGIAGAGAWVNGIEKPPHWVRDQGAPSLNPRRRRQSTRKAS